MIESFLQYLTSEKRVSKHTVVAYQQDLEQFNAFLQERYEHTPAQNANHSMVRGWIVSLVETGRDPRTVNRKIAALRSFYKFLMRLEKVEKDPMTKIRVLKTKKKLPSFIKESEIEQVLTPDLTVEKTEFELIREQLILELFYGTGIRLSELLGLRDSRIDLVAQTIKVVGKRNKERVIPFSGVLARVIRQYIKVRNKNVLKNELDYLLVTESGGPCYPMLIYRIVRHSMQTGTTSEKKSPHVLRHTYATHLLNKGAEINAVKDLLGHSSLAATQAYTHNSMEKLKKVFDQAHPKA